MSFNVLKKKSGYFSLILTIVSGLGWSNAVIALELDIASEVVEVSQAGPVERHKIFLSCEDKPIKQTMMRP